MLSWRVALGLVKAVAAGEHHVGALPGGRPRVPIGGEFRRREAQRPTARPCNRKRPAAASTCRAKPYIIGRVEPQHRRDRRPGWRSASSSSCFEARPSRACVVPPMRHAGPQGDDVLLGEGVMLEVSPMMVARRSAPRTRRPAAPCAKRVIRCWGRWKTKSHRKWEKQMMGAVQIVDERRRSETTQAAARSSAFNTASLPIKHLPSSKAKMGRFVDPAEGRRRFSRAP